MYSHLQREFTELQRSHQLLQTRLQQVTWVLITMMKMIMMMMVVLMVVVKMVKIMLITMTAGKQPDEQLRLSEGGEKPCCAQE